MQYSMGKKLRKYREIIQIKYQKRTIILVNGRGIMSVTITTAITISYVNLFIHNYTTTK